MKIKLVLFNRDICLIIWCLVKDKYLLTDIVLLKMINIFSNEILDSVLIIFCVYLNKNALCFRQYEMQI